MSALRVALLGCGTVGSAVAQQLIERGPVLAERIGRPVELAGVAVRDGSRERDVPGVGQQLFTEDAEGLVAEADLVVELMGGTEATGDLVRSVLARGIGVVTANKQLLAARGPELHAVAAESGAPLRYEAAVAAAIPVLRVVRESLAGDEIETILGVLNGSTNYVLDTVDHSGVAFDHAVAEAGQLGYLEADPTEDLEGIDSAAKILILARLAWGCDLTLEDVQTTGITGLTDEDFANARGTGSVIKLVASARRAGHGRDASYELAVQPVALDRTHPLAGLRGGGNGVVIDTVSAGTLQLFGAGAGGPQTASAVLGDLVEVARAAAATRR
ncbi:homoserine dehydrogenase [Ornithinicoccus halotolerans]|uniref:homoserine dehydrogenase n=1 Tax=Ornithinicoccus halotolerans TaxID=1748220 RepID=UPI001886420B|nr:homoserine dehydrogenase [Ornithinicoccus halotolerans]